MTRPVRQHSVQALRITACVPTYTQVARPSAKEISHGVDPLVHHGHSRRTEKSHRKDNRWHEESLDTV